MNSNLTKELNLSCLLGSGELQMIGFSLHAVHLYLQSGVDLQIFCPCEITNPAGTVWRWQSERINDMTGFAWLLHSEISSLQIVPGDRLVIRFVNGCLLSIRDENDEMLEAFIVRLPDGAFIVV